MVETCLSYMQTPCHCVFGALVYVCRCQRSRKWILIEVADGNENGFKSTHDVYQKRTQNASLDHASHMLGLIWYLSLFHRVIVGVVGLLRGIPRHLYVCGVCHSIIIRSYVSLFCALSIDGPPAWRSHTLTQFKVRSNKTMCYEQSKKILFIKIAKVQNDAHGSPKQHQTNKIYLKLCAHRRHRRPR